MMDPAPQSPARRRRAFGLLAWREHWTLSRRGKWLLLGIALGMLVAGHWIAYPFLAINRPLRGEALIVEGWISVYTVHQAAAAFAAGHYRRVLVVRPLYEGEPGVIHGRSAGEYFASVLKRCGVPPEAVETVFFPGGAQDRTYHSALGVRQWLADHGESVKSLDVATQGPHARRSRLLYEKAFGGSARVGVIALEDPSYDGTHWWRTSEGVRDVLGESVAYLYARFFFSPR